MKIDTNGLPFYTLSMLYLRSREWEYAAEIWVKYLCCSDLALKGCYKGSEQLPVVPWATCRRRLELTKTSLLSTHQPAIEVFSLSPSWLVMSDLSQPTHSPYGTRSRTYFLASYQVQKGFDIFRGWPVQSINYSSVQADHSILKSGCTGSNSRRRAMWRVTITDLLKKLRFRVGLAGKMFILPTHYYSGCIDFLRIMLNRVSKILPKGSFDYLRQRFMTQVTSFL